MNIKEQFKEIPIGQGHNLAGMKFGLLTCLYRTENHASQTMWVCECECGTIKPVPAQNLKRGSTISCGCVNRAKASQRMRAYNESQRTIAPGDKFGNLTVIEWLGLRKQNSRNKNENWYLCQCSCGSEPKEIRGNDLATGAIISCGCINSVGEQAIREILNHNKIKYKTEFMFEDLRNPETNRHLRFDFAIFDDENNLSYLIEFDGRQHFTGPEATWTHGASLETIQFRDKLKNDYCKSHNIILKRIPYFQLSSLSYDNIISDKYNI